MPLSASHCDSAKLPVQMHCVSWFIVQPLLPDARFASCRAVAQRESSSSRASGLVPGIVRLAPSNARCLRWAKKFGLFTA